MLVEVNVGESLVIANDVFVFLISNEQLEVVEQLLLNGEWINVEHFQILTQHLSVDVFPMANSIQSVQINKFTKTTLVGFEQGFVY